MSFLVSHFYRFGDFAIDMDQRILLRAGRPVALTPKVFETLLILVEHGGRIAEKEALMRRLWPDSFVEESNLTFNIQQLRRALGDNARQPLYVETVARRGYRFIAPVEEVLTEAETMPGQIGARTLGRGPVARDGSAAGGAILPGAAVPAEPAAPLLSQPAEPTVTRPLTSRPFLVWAGAGVALICVIAAAAWWLSGKETGPARQLKVERLTANGKSKVAAVSPDGKFIAYVLDEERHQSLRLKNVAAGSDIQILPPAEDVALGSLTFSPDGNYIYYGASRTLYRLPVLGGSPTTILPNFGGALQNNAITFSPDGGQFAFIRYSTEGGESAAIVIANADGTGERVLAASKRPDIFLRSAAWSPDGKVIACAATTAAGPQAVVTVQVAGGRVGTIPSLPWDSIIQVAWRPDGGSLFVIAADADHEYFPQVWQLSYPSGAARNITNDLNNYQSISLTADGRKLVVVRLEQVAHVWVMSGEETSRAKQLTSGFAKYDGTRALAWLVDGQILYSTAPNGKGEVWTVDADGRNAKQIVTGAVSTGPSPDGNYLVFQDEDAEGVGLFRLNVRDGERKRLTKGIDLWATFSPDGQWVVFTRWADQVALWKVPIEGGAPAKLTNILGMPLAPAVSPDGKLIAFFWGGSGRHEAKIGVVPFEGGEVVRAFAVPLQFSMGYGKPAVQWTPDGQAIYYLTQRDGVSNIWRQPLDGRPPAPVTDFQTGRIFNFAYAPDGKRLALSRGTFERDVILLSDPG